MPSRSDRRVNDLRIGVLVSGRGSNLQAILDAIDRGELPAQVAVVLSNHAEVPAIDRARRHGVPAIVLERCAFRSRLEHQLAMARSLSEHRVQLVVLAGFDRVLESAFLKQFEGRVINVHPSLLPAFGGGLQAQIDAFDYGVKVSGCTVHYVTDEIDGGPIILQRAVPVREDDTGESLAARILVEEHKALPEAIRLIAAGRLSIEGRRVRVL